MMMGRNMKNGHCWANAVDFPCGLQSSRAHGHKAGYGEKPIERNCPSNTSNLHGRETYRIGQRESLVGETSQPVVHRDMFEVGRRRYDRGRWLGYRAYEGKRVLAVRPVQQQGMRFGDHQVRRHQSCARP